MDEDKLREMLIEAYRACERSVRASGGMKEGHFEKFIKDED